TFARWRSLTGTPYWCTRSKTVDPLALRAGRSRSLAGARSRCRLHVDADHAALDAHGEAAQPRALGVEPGAAARVVTPLVGAAGQDRPREPAFAQAHALMRAAI